ncbi:hypothetical protein BGX27_006826 [Mortierella sp. AM989]|nr:hypothetical protein BGX27_006826 [Mortierella sp. AM989]
MKYILAPLAALSIFASSFVSAAGEMSQGKKLLSTVGPSGNLPIGMVYAFWPKRKEGEDAKMISITGDNDGSSGDYVAIFKDPKDNKYDLSSEEAMGKVIASDEPMASNSAYSEPDNMDTRVLFSVYLDEDDNVLYSVLGPNVPSSWKDVMNVSNMVTNSLLGKLDPNTPGTKDIKDPGAAMAQLILNNIAMQGPHALEDARNNPILVATLDSAYEASLNWGDVLADLNERVKEEEEEKEIAQRNQPVGTNQNANKVKSDDGKKSLKK